MFVNIESAVWRMGYKVRSRQASNLLMGQDVFIIITHKRKHHRFVLFGAAKISITCSIQTDREDAPKSRRRLCTIGSGHNHTVDSD